MTMRRASWLILFVALCFAAIGFGFALGWTLDELVGR
jgi:hypothetical protein